MESFSYHFQEFENKVADDLKQSKRLRMNELYQKFYKVLEEEIKAKLKPQISEECKKLYSETLRKELRTELTSTIKNECESELSKKIEEKLKIKFSKKLKEDLKNEIEKYKDELPDDLPESIDRIEELEKQIEYLRKKAVKYAEVAKCCTDMPNGMWHGIESFIKIYRKDSDPDPYAEDIDEDTD